MCILTEEQLAQISIKNFKDSNGIYRYIKSLQNQLEIFINNVRSSELILLGDSTIEYTETGDIKSESTASLLTKKLKTRVYSASGGSFSYLLWNHIFDKALENSAIGLELKKALQNKLFLITINIRSFSDEWYLRPSYKYNYIETILKDKISPSDVVLEYFSDKLLKETLAYYKEPLSKTRNPLLYDHLTITPPNTHFLIEDVYSYFKKNPLDVFA